MREKPGFLGEQVASAFQDASVAAAYERRPPYPAETFDLLLELLGDRPGRVLDAGCGTGFVARPLAARGEPGARIERVDAVDCSAAMVAEGRRLSGGDDPRLRWIVARVEDAPLDPPYALITAGDSLHWMDWAVVMPRFATLLAPGAWLAILTVEQVATPWDAALLPVIQRYSTIRDYQPLDLVAELEARGLFTRAGERITAPVPFTQPLEEYITSFHGRASFSPERMAPDELAAFEAAVRAAVRAAVAPHAGETVTLQVMARVTWGWPHGSGAAA